MKHEIYKTKLEKELTKVESELETVGSQNPKNKEDWEAKPDALDIDQADDNEVADKFESLEENNIVLEQLEIQRNAIVHALERIKNDTYGKCEVCGKTIEEERLNANPAATTCVEHKG